MRVNLKYCNIYFYIFILFVFHQLEPLNSQINVNIFHISLRLISSKNNFFLVVVGFVIQPIRSPCPPRLVIVAVVQCDACDMLRKPFAAAKKRSRQKQHTHAQNAAAGERDTRTHRQR